MGGDMGGGGGGWGGMPHMSMLPAGALPTGCTSTPRYAGCHCLTVCFLCCTVVVWVVNIVSCCQQPVQCRRLLACTICRQTPGFNVERPRCQLSGQRAVCQHRPARTSWRHVGRRTKHQGIAAQQQLKHRPPLLQHVLAAEAGPKTPPRHPAARWDSGSTMVSCTTIIQTVTAAVSCGLGLGATPCKREILAEGWLVCCSSPLRPIPWPGE